MFQFNKVYLALCKIPAWLSKFNRNNLTKYALTRDGLQNSHFSSLGLVKEMFRLFPGETGLEVTLQNLL